MVELLARVGRPWVVIVEARVIVVASKRGNERGSRFAARHGDPVNNTQYVSAIVHTMIKINVPIRRLEPRMELDVLDAAFE
jgi:hypothetical protein